MKNYTVYKYRLLRGIGTTTIDMPACAQILSVQVQQGDPTMWVLCDPSMSSATRRFTTFGTEHDIPESFAGRHVATYQTDNGNYAWHVFEDRQ